MMTKHHHRYTVCVDCLLQLVPMRGGSKFMFSLSFSNARSEFLRFFNVCSFWRELTSSSNHGHYHHFIFNEPRAVNGSRLEIWNEP